MWVMWLMPEASTTNLVLASGGHNWGPEGQTLHWLDWLDWLFLRQSVERPGEEGRLESRCFRPQTLNLLSELTGVMIIIVTAATSRRLASVSADYRRAKDTG